MVKKHTKWEGRGANGVEGGKLKKEREWEEDSCGKIIMYVEEELIKISTQNPPGRKLK
jgi:hypothetical protein